MRPVIHFFAASLFVILIATGLHSQPGSHRLLFIGIDGCRPDAVEGATAPNLHQILDDGIASPDALTLYPTWSANGWSTMLTGVNHLKHLAKINSFPESNFDDYPDFITRAEAWYPDFNSFSVVQWNPINYNIIQNCDNEITASSDYDVALASIDILQNEDPHILFIAFNDVDAAGHAYGFHPDIQPYREAIEQTDFYITQIRDALIQRPDFENENWMIAVATDHGGIPAGHGGGTLEERNAFTGWFQSGIEAEELEREVLPDASSVSYVQLPAGTYAQPDNQDMFNFGETQDFTIECWVRAVTGYTEDPVLISNKDWNSGYNPGFVLSATNSQYWKVNLGDGTDRVDIHGGVLGPDWTHIAVSVDRDGIMSAYENGAIVGKEDVTAIGNLDSGLPLVINQDGTLAYGFEAEFDFADIRIWKAALDHQTILDHALNDPDASHPYWTDLLAHWRCDETEGSTLSDNGPLGQPAMIVGSPSWLQASGERVLFDYANAASQEDNAVTALHWLCVPVDPDWHLDGNSLLPACESNGLSAADYPAFLPYPVPARHRIYVPWSAGTVATWYKQDGSVAGTGNVGTGGGMDIPPLSPGIYSLVSEKGMFRIAVE